MVMMHVAVINMIGLETDGPSGFVDWAAVWQYTNKAAFLIAKKVALGSIM